MHQRNRNMEKYKQSTLIKRYQEAKDNGLLQNASESTMRAWIDELRSLFGYDVQNTQQVLTEHTLNKTGRVRLNEVGSSNTRPDYTLVNRMVKLAFVDAKSLDVN